MIDELTILGENPESEEATALSEWFGFRRVEPFGARGRSG
jgi:hypothetical protein